MADVVFNSAKVAFMDGELDLDEPATYDSYVSLHTSTYTANQDTDDFFDDATNQLSGTGYTAGGINLANQATSQDNTDNEAVFDADDVTWSSIDAGTASQVVLRMDGAAASSAPLIASMDSGGFPIVTNGGDLTIQWNTEGILNIT